MEKMSKKKKKFEKGHKKKNKYQQHSKVEELEKWKQTIKGEKSRT